jgi:hypothetical protein
MTCTLRTKDSHRRYSIQLDVGNEYVQSLEAVLGRILQ